MVDSRAGRNLLHQEDWQAPHQASGLRAFAIAQLDILKIVAEAFAAEDGLRAMGQAPLGVLEGKTGR